MKCNKYYEAIIIYIAIVLVLVVCVAFQGCTPKKQLGDFYYECSDNYEYLRNDSYKEIMTDNNGQYKKCTKLN